VKSTSPPLSLLRLSSDDDVEPFQGCSRLSEELKIAGANPKKTSISPIISLRSLFFTANVGWREKNGSGPYIRVLLVDNEGFEYATTPRLK